MNPVSDANSPYVADLIQAIQNQRVYIRSNVSPGIAYAVYIDQNPPQQNVGFVGPIFKDIAITSPYGMSASQGIFKFKDLSLKLDRETIKCALERLNNS